MRRFARVSLILAGLLLSGALLAHSQRSENTQSQQRVSIPEQGLDQNSGILFTDSRDFFVDRTRDRSTASVEHLPAAVWGDQKRLWSAPAHLTKSDLRWLVPFAAASGLLIGTDHHTMTLIHSDAVNRNRSSLISSGGLAAFASATAISYGVGKLTDDEHARETGILAGEALADSFIAAEALQLITSRQRPDVNSGRGLFYRSSPFNSSFPSDHAALAWSAAAILAREYPGPVTQWTAYGLASLISVSRITAEKHFPSDVLIGAAAGYLIGRFVYRAHHDDSMTDRTGATPIAAEPVKAPRSPTSSKHPSHSWPTGSPYVPLDSWVYPALKRLAALGYISDQTSDLAPWTRSECLHQSQEAADTVSTREMAQKQPRLNEEALQLIADLLAELGTESPANTVRIESLYTRVTEIANTPLRDSYHFGQTITNDSGRPYDKGFNNVTGFSASATSGPFFVYLRDEYQEAPGRNADSLAVRQFIAAADLNPLQGPKPIASTNRFEPLEMYAGVKLGFENITFGKQSLWWGPGEASAFSFSTNAEPFYMLRFAQAQPIILPGVLSKLGKIRTEILVGKLSGHQWPARPYVNAQKISLDLTDNLEVGFTRSAFFGGVGHPLTFSNFEASLFSINSQDTGIYGQANNPGDRHSGFDFRYRVPGLRHYVTVYSDSYADDEPNPLDNPKRSAWSPGIYLAQIPGLKHLDFRFETYSTLLYRHDAGGNFIYWNGQYHDSYTNNGNLLGSWIGRDSRAYLASSTYWFSAKSKLQGQYRQTKASAVFLPGGGTQSDASLSGQWSLTSEWIASAAIQYERYYIPLLGLPQHNIVSSLQVTFTPRAWWR